MVAFMVSALLTPSSIQAAADCADGLAGLWGAEVSFGPEVRGALTIYRRGRTWNASISGFAVPVQADDRDLQFRLPGDRGEFRGHLVDSGRFVRGHWIQPTLPHVWGGRYATPVELTLGGRDVWRGSVLPLDDGEGIYLAISRDPSGALSAFVRNPERNLGQYLGPMRVECDGDRVFFAPSQEAAAPIHAIYDHEQRTLSLYLPTESATFDLTRRARDAASGFYPRVSVAKYSYEKPITEGDGWETASLTEVGIDPKPISDLVQSLIDTPISDVAAPYPQALLIARHGKLVLEEYFFGFHRDRVHDVRSAGKTLTTTLVGVAMRRGAPLLGLETKVTSLLSHYGPFAHDDAAKRAITIQHLLTMTSGLDANDDEPASPGTEDRLTAQKDRYKFTLDLPMAHSPGEKAVYSAAGINLLGSVLQHATGRWLPDLIQEEFAVPLTIRHYHLPLGASGDAYMAGGALLRPRDFMKLGQMFLSGGRWRGRQIVSPRWVVDATRAHASIHAEGDYGYGWWIRDVPVGGQVYHTYRAAGNGGQMVIVVPDLDLVVTFTGGNYNQGRVWWRWNDDLVPNVLIPAVDRH
jgi:CubicO group peptidase (beta-lactamase class C family)